jgi:hypothetical protein
MKINNHTNSLRTNVTNDTTDFAIGDASVVIDILRNRLYQNKIQTLVQEYVCNARDAMRESGKPDHAFDVTVPNSNSPTFKVRDYGNGISPDRMANVFVLYGASTKRGNNSQTGGFGIGAKSAWAYTDSFTIVSIFDRVKRTYVAHTGVNNNGRLDLLSEIATTEPSGTEIQIAVASENLTEFENAIYRAIYFWDNKPQLKGTTNFITRDKGLVIGKCEFIEKNSFPDFLNMRYNSIIAVIDGIPYNIYNLVEKSINLSTFYNLVKNCAVFHLNTGDVSVSATRESVDDSKMTLDALDSLAIDTTHKAKAYIATRQKSVNSVKTWLEVYADIKKHFNTDSDSTYGDYTLSYHGDIESKLFDDVSFTTVSKYTESQRRRMGYRTPEINGKINKNKKKDLDFTDIDKLYYNSAVESVQTTNKRINELFRTQDTFVLVESQDPSILKLIAQDLGMRDLATVTYADKPRAPRAARGTVKADTEITLHTFNGYNKVVNLDPATNTDKYLYYPVRSDAYDKEKLQELDNYLSHTRGVKVVGLGDKAIAAISRDKNFESLESWLAAYIPNHQDIARAKSDASQHGDTMLALEGKTTKDIFINEMINEYSIINKDDPTLQIPSMLLDKVTNFTTVVAFRARDEKLFDVVNKKYPLMRFASSARLAREDGKILLDEIVYYIDSKN